ncbi:MAG: aminotransferase class V-fold PLP-dependent enzyme, partial [Bacilli bacterium]
MYYFDNSSTALLKPDSVGLSVLDAINNLGNANRSFYPASLNATKLVFETKKALANLVAGQVENIALTSSATESLNLVINGLITSNDHVIASVFDHNSSLRPLYQIGADLDFILCDYLGQLDYEMIESLIKPHTKYIVFNHASNVTGEVVKLDYMINLAIKHNLILIVDVAQSLGHVPIKYHPRCIYCFTGHKGLFGPLGTGGVIASPNIDFKPIKTGGTGHHTFDALTSHHLPEVFEVGSLNVHSLAGLKSGVDFVLDKTLD